MGYSYFKKLRGIRPPSQIPNTNAQLDPRGATPQDLAQRHHPRRQAGNSLAHCLGLSSFPFIKGYQGANPGRLCRSLHLSGDSFALYSIHALTPTWFPQGRYSCADPVPPRPTHAEISAVRLPLLLCYLDAVLTLFLDPWAHLPGFMRPKVVKRSHYENKPDSTVRRVFHPLAPAQLRVFGNSTSSTRVRRRLGALPG